MTSWADYYETLEDDQAALEKEVGASRIHDVEIMRYWLYSKDPGYESNYTLRYRPAPSIVVRSECELFGASSPRFAYRAYLLPDNPDCFVNLRRIETLARSLGSWGERTSEQAGRLSALDVDCEFAIKKTPTTIVQSATCVADSLLAVPRRLADSDYRFTCCDLGRAYGEPDTGQTRDLVPFIKHMRLGGGMCAQAACFMATAVLNEFANGIFGVPEITFLGQHESATEIDIGGMSPNDIESYFRHPSVGLWGCNQKVSTEFLRASDTASKESAESRDEFNLDAFCRALRSYLLSGMPAVIPVDLGALAVRSSSGQQAVFERNSYPFLTEVDTPDEDNLHAVLAVAASENQPREFVINDPATYPFLSASGSQLLDAHPCRATSPTALLLGGFISVTPKEVKLPLLDAEADDGMVGGSTRTAGLFSLSLSLQLRYPESLPFGMDTAVGELRLFNSRIHCCADNELETQCKIPFNIAEQIQLMHRGGKLRPQWYWVQFRSDSNGKSWAWVWDAEKAPQHGGISFGQALDKYVVAVLEFTNEDCTTHFLRPMGRPANASKPSRNNLKHRGEPKALRAALISSFDTRTNYWVAQNWPGQDDLGLEPACEYYAFMQPEIDRLCKMLKIKDAIDAVDFMAECAEAPDRITRVAERITKFLGKKIIGIASFVPAISAIPGSHDATKAIRAIRFLASLAKELQEIGHEVRSIELVAGSLVNGVWPGIPKDIDDAASFLRRNSKRSYVANRVPDSEACRRLGVNLHAALKSEECSAVRESITWALELEPGPLFVLRDWKTLRNLNALLEQHRIFDNVGFNLDVAHWRLAARHAWEEGTQITLEALRYDPVFGRITHAHISGHHHAGHFGDLPLSWVNSLDDFTAWIDLLRERRNSENCTLAFSGYVSMELEALHRSVDLYAIQAELQNLLGLQ